MPFDPQPYGLGPRLDTRGVPDNPWISVLERDATQVISWVAPSRQIGFMITESLDLQAGAGFQDQVVLVAFGLADMMCRLASALITEGVFVSFGDTRPSWTTDSAAAEQPASLQLQSERFRWRDGHIPWLSDPKRQMIFAYLLLSMSRFVVLHEVGHLVFEHGRVAPRIDTTQPRKKAIIDGAASDEDVAEAAIASQAKEIAADNFAFHALLDLQEAESSELRWDPMRQLLNEKLVGSPRRQLRWTLLSAFLVFKLLDRRRWSFETARHATHPPAPFRLKSIYAAALAAERDQLPRNVVVEELRVAQELGSAVISVGLQQLPRLTWLQEVDGPEFDAHFAAIASQVPGWSEWDGV